VTSVEQDKLLTVKEGYTAAVRLYGCHQEVVGSSHVQTGSSVNKIRLSSATQAYLRKVGGRWNVGTTNTTKPFRLLTQAVKFLPQEMR